MYCLEEFIYGSFQQNIFLKIISYNSKNIIYGASMQKLLEKQDISSSELISLLEARQKGEVKFTLIDVREQYEYDEAYIKGVDMLNPTSSFQSWAEEIFNTKADETIIFTCRTGNRSGQVQNVFKQNGHQKVLNHFGGIVTYDGEVVN